MNAIRAIVLGALIGVMGCASSGCGPSAQPFEFLGGQGSGRVVARVYGQQVAIGIGVDVIHRDDEVIACPVATVTMNGLATSGTHSGANPLCIERFGVLGVIEPAPSFRED